jgi:hypothetical protein
MGSGVGRGSSRPVCGSCGGESLVIPLDIFGVEDEEGGADLDEEKAVGEGVGEGTVDALRVAVLFGPVCWRIIAL